MSGGELAAETVEVIANITVREAGRGGRFAVRFEFPPTGEVIDLPLPDRQPFRAARRKAGVYLERFVPLAARLDARATVGEALRNLHNYGRELTRLLVQGDMQRMIRLEEAFGLAWPAWASALWTDPDFPIPVVQVYGRDDAFPFELLPLFDFGALPQKLGGDDALNAVAARFLAFTAVVHRVLPVASTGDHVLRNKPALPVQFMRHRKLAAKEERFLSSLAPHVDVEGPWPERQDEDSMRAALVAALYGGGRLADGSPSAPPVQIQHFACHCDTTAELDDDYVLELTTNNGKKRPITFGAMRQGYDDRFFVDRKRRARAMIVLNACASSRTNPLTAWSFPHWFLGYGHRAFVGTETYVPDAIAGAYAACLYGRLLEGQRLGEAVVCARRDLIRDHHNPLGVLYVMYGDPDLAVEEPIPGVHRAVSAT